METGTIADRMSWGAARIVPAVGGGSVVFTKRVFNEDWSMAFDGRPVRFERFAQDPGHAKRVIGL